MKIKRKNRKEKEEEKQEVKFLWTIPVKDLPRLKEALARYEAENPGTIQSVRVGPRVKLPETKDQLN